jgi:Tfp pilus assembly protein PilE
MKLNNRGFSLAELIVASGIGVMLAGIAGFSFIEAMNMFTRTTRQYTAEADMIGAMYTLKSTLSQSSVVLYGGDASTANNSWSNKTVFGAVPNRVSDGVLFRYPAATGSGIYLIAMANRELSSDSSTNPFVSKIYGTAIYYQRYEYTTSGALYFDMERNANGAAGTDAGGEWVHLSPRNAPFAYGRMTEFKVEKIRVLNTDNSITMDAGAGDTNKPVLGADFKIIMRYFTRGLVSDWRWCPSALISGTAACRSNTNYYDIEKTLKVTFANNTLQNPRTGVGMPGIGPRAYGNLFFFHSVPPSSRR